MLIKTFFKLLWAQGKKQLLPPTRGTQTQSDMIHEEPLEKPDALWQAYVKFLSLTVLNPLKYGVRVHPQNLGW